MARFLSLVRGRARTAGGWTQERLSKTGDNLANVIQYLSEEHPEILKSIFDRLRSRVPKIESVRADQMPDGRLLLQFKEAPFAGACHGSLCIGWHAKDALPIWLCCMIQLLLRLLGSRCREHPASPPFVWVGGRMPNRHKCNASSCDHPLSVFSRRSAPPMKCGCFGVTNPAIHNVPL